MLQTKAPFPCDKMEMQACKLQAYISILTYRAQNFYSDIFLIL